MDLSGRKITRHECADCGSERGRTHEPDCPARGGTISYVAVEYAPVGGVVSDIAAGYSPGSHERLITRCDELWRENERLRREVVEARDERDRAGVAAMKAQQERDAAREVEDDA